MSGFHPPTFDWQAHNQPDEFRSFKQYCSFIFDGPFSSKTAKEKVSFVLIWLGKPGMNLFHSWTWTNDADKEDLKVVFEKFERHFQPKSNAWLARFQLGQLRQQASESVDEFIARCRLQAQSCSFADEADLCTRLVEQLIVGTRHRSVQEKLLERGDQLTTLDEALDIARTHEATIRQMAQLGKPAPQPAEVEAIGAHGRRPNNAGHNSSKKSSTINCMYCGQVHVRDKNACPALGKECSVCGKKNHFAKVCKSKVKQAHDSC